MLMTFSGRSAPSAMKIAEASDGQIRLNRGSQGLVNWGRNIANTQLNPNISNTTNKRVMRQKFQLDDVPMPRLYTLHEAHALAKQGKLLVGRPDQHTKGRGFWKVWDNASFMRAINGTRRKKAATHFMEYIESDREYRVHIFKDKSIRISEKGFTDASKKEYITRKPDRPVRNVREAAKQAVAAVGLDFGAVDVLAAGEGNEQVWVLEVNAAPGLGGSMPKLYADTFLTWERGEL